MAGYDEPTFSDMDAHRAFARHYLASTEPVSVGQDAQDVRRGRPDGYTWREVRATFSPDAGYGEEPLRQASATEQAQQLSKLLHCALAEAEQVFHRVSGPQPTAGNTVGGEGIGKDASLADLLGSNTILAQRLISQLMAIRERI